MENVDLILAAKYIVTLDSYNRVFHRGAIAIKNGIVVEVGREEDVRSKYRAEEVVERRHHIVVPGLVDCHTHTQQYLLRSVLTDEMLQLPPVWTKVLVPFERAMSRELARLSVKASIANMLRNGITYFVEAGAPYPDVLAEEVLKTGVKGVVTYATYDIAEERVAEPEHVLREAKRLIEKYGTISSNLRVWMSIRQVMMASEKLLEAIVEIAREHEIGLTIHLGEYQGEVDYTLAKYGKRPLEYMIMKGLGDIKPVVISHGLFLSPREIDLAKKFGFGICWCPTVDSWITGAHWLGLIKPEELKVGIGSDGGAWNRLDILHEVKIARAISKTLGNSILYFKAGLDSNTAMKMLTASQGEVVGEKIGKIEKGYPADITVLSFKSTTLLPVVNPVDLVVNYMEGGDVTDVLVNGKFLVKNNQILVLDEEEIIKELLDREQTIKSIIEELAKTLPLNQDPSKIT